jgi:hypothetical protein
LIRPEAVAAVVSPLRNAHRDSSASAAGQVATFDLKDERKSGSSKWNPFWFFPPVSKGTDREKFYQSFVSGSRRVRKSLLSDCVAVVQLSAEAQQGGTKRAETEQA